ncbi:MAG TPA: molybdopterin-dependent oxidoreductase, partial [Ktedonobacterales bacterium]
SACPPTPRVVNMNRLGAALTGEVREPPIRALYVFCANPVASAPNASLTVRGLQRADLFTVVHELFLTDTARYADLVLPATSQLEQTDLHKGYGHRSLQYNAPAIAPLGEAKSNWQVMRLLAEALGYAEPWLRQSEEEVIAEVLAATRATNPLLAGLTLERLQAEGTFALPFPLEREVPFSDGHFPTPSGKLELRCDALAAHGLDPLPDYVPPAEFAAHPSYQEHGNARTGPFNTAATEVSVVARHAVPAGLTELSTQHPAASSVSSAVSSDLMGVGPLILLSGAAHHFTSSSMANLPSLLAKEGAPSIELHPDDAAARGIQQGDEVVVGNARGACRLRAVLTPSLPPGVAVVPKGRWPRLNPDGRNINWTTSDTLADLAGQSTFHSNLVTVRRSTTATTEGP